MGVEITVMRALSLTAAVMPREGHGSRNVEAVDLVPRPDRSCPARGMGVEMHTVYHGHIVARVMPREGHGSRNW